MDKWLLLVAGLAATSCSNEPSAAGTSDRFQERAAYPGVNAVGPQRKCADIISLGTGLTNDSLGFQYGAAESAEAFVPVRLAAAPCADVAYRAVLLLTATDTGWDGDTATATIVGEGRARAASGVEGGLEFVFSPAPDPEARLYRVHVSTADGQQVLDTAEAPAPNCGYVDVTGPDEPLGMGCVESGRQFR